ncbi:ABC transporter ATP-binding protein [Telmatospirillum sp.]|uniref:ABC transporter ATP-binding protein n=1 Tax=Telmatospirillum sp. TaxID=2079197 RepID=UPI00284BAA35|nr:ABC transporter ATP-binding protein [Telmatospirillum sp.]MDR3435966.1 ABC transporter ATP-binding protein [Telmatospirillum sp.]
MPPSAAVSPSLDIENLMVTVAEGSGRRITILDVPALSVAPGERLGIAGPSGAGKTTLLHVLAGLLPGSGRLAWGAVELSALPEVARDRWRRDNVGFVFQDFALVPELSVLANILLPISFDHWRVPAHLRARAIELATEMALPETSRRALLLSRGEQQRVAVARALLCCPRLILADEPTASLDADSGAAVIDLLIGGARKTGATLIAVSHDARFLARLDRVVHMEQGGLITASTNDDGERP